MQLHDERQAWKRACDLPSTDAPQWWYDCFTQGRHDMSIYEIEWAYEAYLRMRPMGESGSTKANHITNP